MTTGQATSAGLPGAAGGITPMATPLARIAPMTSTLQCAEMRIPARRATGIPCSRPCLLGLSETHRHLRRGGMPGPLVHDRRADGTSSRSAAARVGVIVWRKRSRSSRRNWQCRKSGDAGPGLRAERGGEWDHLFAHNASDGAHRLQYPPGAALVTRMEGQHPERGICGKLALGNRRSMATAWASVRTSA